MTTWLLSGASLFTWLIYLVATHFGDQFGFVSLRLQQSVTAFTFLTLLCNHPHFAASYVLAYGQGGRFILRHWFTLLLVPVALVTALGFAFIDWNGPLTILGQYSTGSSILVVLVHLMFAASGWHYSQQVFGCVVAMAYKKKENLTNEGRGWLKGHLVLLVISYLSWINRSLTENELTQYQSLSVPVLDISLSVSYFFGALTVLSGIVALIKLKPGLSWQTLLPWPAFVVWYFPFMKDPIFYLLAVPFFHSLQYLVFAVPALKQKKPWQNSLMAIWVLLLGWIGFDAFPAIMDVKMYEVWPTDLNFFLMASGLFINIHHFFIDSSIWKRGEGILSRVITNS